MFTLCIVPLSELKATTTVSYSDLSYAVNQGA